MNLVVLMGRLTRDPELSYSQSNMAIAKYTLAVADPFKKSGANANFIHCTALGKNAEFAEKYLSQGMMIAVQGRWQTGSYKNKDGNTVYTNNCMVDKHFFAESKKAFEERVAHEEKSAPEEPYPVEEQPVQEDNGFMPTPPAMDDDLPFN